MDQNRHTGPARLMAVASSMDLGMGCQPNENGLVKLNPGVGHGKNRGLIP